MSIFTIKSLGKKPQKGSSFRTLITIKNVVFNSLIYYNLLLYFLFQRDDPKILKMTRILPDLPSLSEDKLTPTPQLHTTNTKPLPSTLTSKPGIHQVLR